MALAAWCAAPGLALGSFNFAPGWRSSALALAVAGRWSSIPPFWGLPTAFLSGTSAAGGIAMINSVGNLGGFVGPYVMGTLRTSPVTTRSDFACSQLPSCVAG